MTTTSSLHNARVKADRASTIPPERRVVVATVSTSHFDFVAVGATATDAKAALLAAWDRHRAQFTGAEPDYMRNLILGGEVRFHFMPMGGATRDGEAL